MKSNDSRIKSNAKNSAKKQNTFKFFFFFIMDESL